MSDYALVRTRSALALSAPCSTLCRTYSVPNLSVPYYSSYYSYPYSNYSSYYSYPYSSWRNYWPYRYRDYTYSDSYWYDRYYYFSPLYYRSLFPYRRYSYSDGITNPYYWSSPYSYWTRYKSYLYDYDYPSYYSRWSSSAAGADPYTDAYTRTYRYRSWLLDSMEDSLAKGLAQYREGTINYNQLYRGWITSNDWYKRHKDWRQLYAWDRDVRKPEPPARTYRADWVPAIDRSPLNHHPDQ